MEHFLEHMLQVFFYNKAKTKELDFGFVCSSSHKSLAVEYVCVHILNCCSGISIRDEMNGLHDLKMYSTYDFHYRVRADKRSDVCTLSVGQWLESLYSSFIREHEDKQQHSQFLFRGQGTQIVKVILEKQQPGFGNGPQKFF